MRGRKIPYSQDELNGLLEYDPETGNLYLKKATRLRREGAIADYKDDRGYRKLAIEGVKYLSHRIIWKMLYGTDPEQIDHINRIRDDNRLVNLREATHSQNCHNSTMQSNNTSGYRGVRFMKPAKKWEASIQIAKKRHRLGYFSTPEEAHIAIQRFIARQPSVKEFRAVSL